MGIWRFRLVRSDETSAFIARPANEPFTGSIAEALAFADRVFQHFADRDPRRVEAWSVDLVEPEPSDRELFQIERHENGRDWRLLEARLTHPGWFVELIHAVDHVGFRARGHRWQLTVS